MDCIKNNMRKECVRGSGRKNMVPTPHNMRQRHDGDDNKTI